MVRFQDNKFTLQRGTLIQSLHPINPGTNVLIKFGGAVEQPVQDNEKFTTLIQVDRCQND